MKQVNKSAVEAFYSEPHGSYDRTDSFFEVVSHEPDEKYTDNSCILTYTYSASDVTVNPWEAPWGKTYEGKPEKAFETAFEHGLHGGPRPTRGGWSWQPVNKSTPIIELIDRGIEEIEI